MTLYQLLREFSYAHNKLGNGTSWDTRQRALTGTLVAAHLLINVLGSSKSYCIVITLLLLLGSGLA